MRENGHAGESFNFDEMEPIVVPVTKGGVEYELRQATGGAAKIFHNARLACIGEIGPNGKPTKLKNLGDLEPLLVHLCLFDAKGKRVPQAVVESWPSPMQKRLYKKAAEISDLDERDETDAGSMLAKALQLPDAPCGLAKLREFVESLDDSFTPLKTFLKPTTAETVKNEQGATEAGLG